jgi:hypothetical protein
MLFKKHLVVVLCLLFYSCNQELKTTFSEVEITTETNTLVTVNIPKAFGNPTISNNINFEINKQVINALQVGEPNSATLSSVEESIHAFNNEYQTFSKEYPEVSMPWEAQIDGGLLFQSDEIISVSITSYLNTGGAHGNTVIVFLNFDAQTGKRIKNADLITGEAGFKKLAASYFERNITADSVLFKSDGFQLPENMGYVDEGIHLLYNTYEMAPYTTGIIEFTIPFKEAGSFLAFNGS